MPRTMTTEKKKWHNVVNNEAVSLFSHLEELKSFSPLRSGLEQNEMEHRLSTDFSTHKQTVEDLRFLSVAPSGITH